MQLPNIWGEGGALFAFSGMDGETDVCALVGSTLDSGRGLVFHVSGRPALRVGVRSSGRDCFRFDRVTDEVVSGGLAISRLEIGRAVLKVSFVFLDRNTIGIRVVCEKAVGPVEVFSEISLEEAGGTGGVACALIGKGELAEFTFSYSPVNGATRVANAQAEMSSGIDSAIERELSYFRSLPKPNTSDTELERAYYKCASVLKVNCCTAQGDIPFPWTTPDRWPHRHMWIWDSAFHAIGLRHISHEWAENAIKAVLAAQREDGFIPHTITVDRRRDSDLIQPPILAWAALKVYEITRNREFLEWVYPRLDKMIRYDCEAMDKDSDGLSEWGHGFASGMDNSPRFDQPVAAAIDLNCFIVQDARCLASIAQELERAAEVKEWNRLTDQRASRINDRLWDDETGFYYDRGPSGGLVKIKTVAGFTPLFAGVCDARRAEALVSHLTSECEFWRAFPVASVAADEPTFCDDMWRGPTWVNYNYLIIEGLRHYGFCAVADEMADRTISEIARWYTLTGLVYEYYDSEAVTEPWHLHRKERGGRPAKKCVTDRNTAVRDFNWTAALYIDLLLREQSLPLKAHPF